MSGTSSKARRKGESVIEFVMSEVFVFMKQTFPFPRLVNRATSGLNEGKKLSAEAPSPGFRRWFLEILQKISPASQDKIVMQMAESGHALQLSVCLAKRNDALACSADLVALFMPAVAFIVGVHFFGLARATVSGGGRVFV
jgi:hypothetical protein